MKHVVGFLLLCFAVVGDTSKDDPLPRVYASVGHSAILPCHQEIPNNTEVPTLEWSKVDPEGKVIRAFVYRQGVEVYAEKHKDFEFRSHLFMSDVHNGNFSMLLKEVKETDAGIYICKTLWDNRHDKKMVELVVEGTKDSCTLSMIFAGLGSVVSILFLEGVVYLIYKYCTKSGEMKNKLRQSSIETSTSSGSESKLLCQPEPRTPESTRIEMEDTSETDLTTTPPDVITSTPTSTITKAESRNVKIFDIFDVTDNDAVDAKPSTSEIQTPSKSVKFQNQEENKRTTLIRQDTRSDDVFVPQTRLSKSTFSLTDEISKSPTKKPVMRSRSVSESCSVSFSDLTSQYRRQSIAVPKPDTETLLQEVQEETETDGNTKL